MAGTSILRSGLAALFVLQSALLGGCSIEKIAADSMVPVLVKTKNSFNRSSVPLAARESAPGLLVTLDGILAASPDNEELLLLKAELSAGFAFALLEEEYRRADRAYQEKRARELRAWTNELYGNARSAARHALELSAEGIPELIETGDPEKLGAALRAELDRDDVGAVFWYGFAWGTSINLNLDQGASVTKDVPRVRALMQWVIDTDERYFHGGAHLFFALLNLSVGKSLGGRPDVALEHLQAVDAITENRMLMSKVLYAEYYLPQVQTPSGNVSAEQRTATARKVWNEYLAVLQAVMKAPAGLWPEQRLLNAIAKERAEDLYYRADDVLFPPPGVEIPRREGDEDEDEDEEE